MSSYRAPGIKLILQCDKINYTFYRKHFSSTLSLFANYHSWFWCTSFHNPVVSSSFFQFVLNQQISSSFPWHLTTILLMVLPTTLFLSCVYPIFVIIYCICCLSHISVYIHFGWVRFSISMRDLRDCWNLAEWRLNSIWVRPNASNFFLKSWLSLASIFTNVISPTAKSKNVMLLSAESKTLLD